MAIDQSITLSYKSLPLTGKMATVTDNSLNHAVDNTLE